MSDYRTKIQKQQIQMLKQNTELFNEVFNNSKYKSISNYIEMVEKNCIQYSDGMQLFIIRIIKNIFCCNNLYKIPVSFLLTAKQLTPYNEVMGIKRNIRYTQKKLQILVDEGFLGRVKVEGLKGYFYYLKHDITKPFDRTGKNDFEEKNTDTTPAEDDMLQMEKEDYNDEEKKTNTLTITDTQQAYLTLLNKKTNEQEEKQNTEATFLQCLDELEKIDIGNYSKEEFKMMFVEFCRQRKDSKDKPIKQKSSRAMTMIVSTLKRLSNEFGLNAFECLKRGLSDDWRGIKVEYFKNEIERQKQNNEPLNVNAAQLLAIKEVFNDCYFGKKSDSRCFLNILDCFGKKSKHTGYKICKIILQSYIEKHINKLKKQQSVIDETKQRLYNDFNSILFKAQQEGEIKYIPVLFVKEFFLNKPEKWEEDIDEFFFSAFLNKTKIDKFTKEYIDKHFARKINSFTNKTEQAFYRTFILNICLNNVFNSEVQDVDVQEFLDVLNNITLDLKPKEKCNIKGFELKDKNKQKEIEEIIKKNIAKTEKQIIKKDSKIEDNFNLQFKVNFV